MIGSSKVNIVLTIDLFLAGGAGGFLVSSISFNFSLYTSYIEFSRWNIPITYLASSIFPFGINELGLSGITFVTIAIMIVKMAKKFKLMTSLHLTV